jgi:hypothetical protein
LACVTYLLTYLPWEGFTTQVVTLWCFNKVRPAVTDHREHCRRDAPRTDRFGFVVVSRARHGSTRPARRNLELYSVGQSVGLDVDPERRGLCNPPRPAGRAPGSTRARPAGPPIWRGNACTTMRGGPPAAPARAGNSRASLEGVTRAPRHQDHAHADKSAESARRIRHRLKIGIRSDRERKS